MGFNGRYLSSGTLSLTGSHHPSCCNAGAVSGGGLRLVTATSLDVGFGDTALQKVEKYDQYNRCRRSNGYRTSILGTIDATAAGHGMIVDARMDEEHTVKSEADIPDSIRWRNEYVGCSCGFKANMSEADSKTNAEQKTILHYSGGVDPGSMTCDMCASELDMRDGSEPKVDVEGREVIRLCHKYSFPYNRGSP